MNIQPRDMNERLRMKRREFLGVAAAAGMSGALPISVPRPAEARTAECVETALVPESLGGMSVEALREDYRHRLFKQYLPFWEKDACDRKYGGFMCELNDDGSISSDEKFIWYQGRAIWVYSFLYNHFGKDSHWLDIATRTRDFMVNRMYAGDGKWVEKVRRDGTLLEGVGRNVYGWLFAAGGLAQYHIATNSPRDRELARQSLLAAIDTYDDPNYADPFVPQYSALDLPDKGLRSVGHSMLFIWVLSQLLSAGDGAHLAQLQKQHVDLFMNRFWNADYGIVNDCLGHDYSRILAAESHMYSGHALEALWIVMDEAIRTGNRALFDTAAVRIRRLLEMCWDYVFEGWSGDNYFVFTTPKHAQGPNFDMKTMWAQCEVLIGCLIILQYTGQTWAKEWYDRTRAFVLRTMPVAAHGVWRQAVDRRGKDVKRVGISAKRKDNFHQARMLMLNLLSLDRLIADQRKLTPFPKRAATHGT